MPRHLLINFLQSLTEYIYLFIYQSIMKVRKDHDAMRQAVCVGCLRPGSQRIVTEASIADVKRAVVSDFDLTDTSLPIGICNSCRSKVKDPNYQCSLNYGHLRSGFKAQVGLEQSCGCYICQAGHSKTFKRSSAKPGPKLPLPITVCPRCFANNPPANHKCSLGQRAENVLQMVPESVSQQVASKVVNNNTDPVTKTCSLKNIRGRRMTIHTGQRSHQPMVKRLNFKDLDEMRKRLQLSDRGALLYLRKHRTLVGRKSVQPHAAKYMAECARQETSFLKITPIKLASEANSELEHKQVVHVENIGDYVEHVVIRRGIPREDVLVKFLGDTGGQFFKTSVSVIDLRNVASEAASGQQTKARSTYTDPAGDYKDTSVEKLLITGMCAKAKEDYELVKKVIDLQGLDTLGYQQVHGGDQKYVNLICGIGPHSSKFPCPYCHSDSSFTSGIDHLRTFGDIRREYQQFQEDLARYEEALIEYQAALEDYKAGRIPRRPVKPHKPEAKEYFSCVNLPVIQFPDDMYVLEAVPVPGLHVVLRFTNWHYKTLGKLWSASVGDGSDPADAFLKSKYLVPNTYQGQDLDGNKCMDLLRLHESLKTDLPPELKGWADLFKSFLDFADNCLTVAGPPDNYVVDYVDKLKANLEDLEIELTPSSHSAVHHVKHFYDLAGTKFGLGLFSEQAGEALHYRWEDRVYNHAYRRPESHPQFAPQLMKGVGKWNSLNI